MRVLVSGVTGQIGSRVARALSASGADVCGLVRGNLAERDGAAGLDGAYEAISGDLGDIASLDRAVDGCDAVFIASSIHPDQVVLQTNLVQAAAASGRHPTLVKLSGLGTALHSFVDSGRWHAEIEDAMQASELPAISLRPPFFMQNLAVPLQIAATTGVLSGQDDVEIAMIDAADIAAMAAHFLLAPPQAAFQALTITGPKAHSFRGVAETMSRVLGRQVRFEPTTHEETRHSLERRGMHAWHVDIMVQFRRAFAQGWGATVTDHVAATLGRAPIELASSLAAMHDEELLRAPGQKTTRALDGAVQGK